MFPVPLPTFRHATHALLFACLALVGADAAPARAAMLLDSACPPPDYALDAGGDQTATVGQRVELAVEIEQAPRSDACPGADANPGLAWSLISPAGSKARLAQDAGGRAWFVPDVAGDYWAALAAGDAEAVVRLRVSVVAPPGAPEAAADLDGRGLRGDLDRSDLDDSDHDDGGEREDAPGQDPAVHPTYLEPPALQRSPEPAPDAPAVLLPAQPRGWFRDPAKAATSVALAVGEFDSLVYAFRRADDATLLFQTYSPGSRGWLSESAWTAVPGGGKSKTAPAVAVRPGVALYLFMVGSDTGRVYVNTKRPADYPTGGWSGWRAESLPGGSTDAAVAAFANSGGRVYVIRKGGDGRLYYSRRAATWSAWTAVPGDARTAVAPAVAYDAAAGLAYVFYVGLDGKMYVRTLGESAAVASRPALWGAWCEVRHGGDYLRTDAPVAAVAAYKGLMLFHKGTDGRIYAQTYNGSCGADGWTATTEVGGSAQTDQAPAAAGYATNGGGSGRTMLWIRRTDTPGIFYNILATLRVQAIRVSDDDGLYRAEISPDQAAEWVAYANRVYAPGDIRLVFNPSTDFTDLRASRLNRTYLCDADRTTNCFTQADAGKAAEAYAGRVVTLFRFGDDVVGGHARVATGLAFSWYTYPVITMPGFGINWVCSRDRQNIGLFAHELGHYLGLWHTFPEDPEVPATEGPIRLFTWERALAWLAAKGNDRHLAFDNDRAYAADTEADPGTRAIPACDPADTRITLNDVTWLPPRSNIMSYYAPPDVPAMRLSGHQLDRIHFVLDVCRPLGISGRCPDP